LAASAVKTVALEHGLRVHQPGSALDLDGDGDLAHVDALVVAAFGMILQPRILNLPPLGCINVHASLLPRWRGAAPIQRAIQAGDSVTGISIMKMNAGVDTGPVLLRQYCPVRGDDTGGSLHDRLAAMGGECLLQALRGLALDGLSPQPQNESLACYAPRISKQETRINWAGCAAAIERLVRAFNPVPAARASLAGTDFRILDVRALEAIPPRRAPGTVFAASADGIDVAAGRGVVRVVTLQAPGKKPVSAHDFLNANPGWPRTV
jgi:methionyl-tRNA formyltransferase